VRGPTLKQVALGPSSRLVIGRAANRDVEVGKDETCPDDHQNDTQDVHHRSGLHTTNTTVATVCELIHEIVANRCFRRVTISTQLAGSERRRALAVTTLMSRLSGFERLLNLPEDWVYWPVKRPAMASGRDRSRNPQSCVIGCESAALVASNCRLVNSSVRCRKSIKASAMLTNLRKLPITEPVKKSCRFPANRDSLERWAAVFAGS
jgi:hypothetical protein